MSSSSARSHSKLETVVLTGIGLITPLGCDRHTCWEHLLNGVSGIGPVDKFDTIECQTKIGGQLPSDYVGMEATQLKKRLRKQTVRTTRMALLAAREAIADSGLDLTTLDKNRCAVVHGTSGAFLETDFNSKANAKYQIIRGMANAPAAWVSLDFGFKGVSFSVSANGDSGSRAIAQACDLLRRQQADVVVSGGADAMLDRHFVKRYNSCRLLSTANQYPTRAVRPFDSQRDGFVLSDGACMLVLETRAHAHQRGVQPYATIEGFSACNVPQGLETVQDRAAALAKAMESALKDARLTPEKIAYVSADGQATVDGDIAETLALKSVFGRHSDRLLISSQKSMLGHTIGASGAIELASTALALKTGKIPPTIHLEDPDPICDLNYVPNAMIRTPRMQASMSNSCGLKGNNHCFVLTRND